MKVTKIRNDLAFLRICDEADLTPKFLMFKLSNPGLRSTRDLFFVRKRLLHKEVRMKRRQLCQAELSLVATRDSLKALVRYIDYCFLTNFAQRNAEHSGEKNRTTQMNKIDRLRLHNSSLTTASSPTASFINPDKVIHNHSDYVLSDVEKAALARGLTFGLPPTKLKYGNYLSQFESLAHQSPSKLFYKDCPFDHNTFTTKLKSIALSSFFRYNSKPPPHSIPKEELVALKALAKEKSIVVLRPDKGNGVVILSKADYIAKMDVILSDTTKFAKITTHKDGYARARYLERRTRKLLKDLHNDRQLSDKLYKSLYPNGSQVGLLYGLPKIHKKDVPLRPILSAIGTHSYALAKYLVDVIQPVSNLAGYSIKDSFKFAELAKSLNIKNKYMASLDISSLFTNVPLDQVIDICCERLYHTSDSIPCPPHREEDFRQLLTAAVTKTSFLFNDILYEQVDGISMGNPLGPVLANVFVDWLEEKYMSPHPAFPPTYVRYMDDSFCVFRDQAQLDLFLAFSNTVHPNITFTKEEEVDGKLPFLDILVTRHPTRDTPDTSTYRKPTFSGLYFHFASFIPIDYKIALIRSLVQRCYQLARDYNLFHIDVSYVSRVLKLNAFPVELINEIIGKVLLKFQCPKVISTVSGKETFIILPFVGPDSFTLKSNLVKLYGQCFPQFKLKVIFKVDRRISSFFRVKDVIPVEWKSHVVYELSCDACNASYIGKTVNTLRERFISGANAHLKFDQKFESPFKLHLRDNPTHSFDRDKIEVLDSSPYNVDLETKESLYISYLKPSLNTDTKSRPLLLF